jgi:hypothetical protein
MFPYCALRVKNQSKNVAASSAPKLPTVRVAR